MTNAMRNLSEFLSLLHSVKWCLWAASLTPFGGTDQQTSYHSLLQFECPFVYRHLTSNGWPRTDEANKTWRIKPVNLAEKAMGMYSEGTGVWKLLRRVFQVASTGVPSSGHC